MKIIILGTDPSYLLNFRGELIHLINKNNHEVIGMCLPPTLNIERDLNQLGAKLNPYFIERNSLNPISDIKTFLYLRKTFKEINPDIILAYTIKPIIWGGLAARAAPNATTYAMVEGLGFVFQQKSRLRSVLKALIVNLYKIALKRSPAVIFLNNDNLNEFISNNIIPRKKAKLINGIGVNLQHYTSKDQPTGMTIFLTIGRLLGEKGFREYAQAAQIVKAQYPETIFQLLGHEDPSPDGIPMNEVKGWHQCGYLEYLGTTTDVRPYLEQCHVFVLPSYHEGLPRTTMEAMATGRPILTTDVPGCRETVISGENGYLVPKANAEALAERMIWFIENHDQCKRMGKRSRELAEDRYDVHKINKQLMEIMGLTVNE